MTSMAVPVDRAYFAKEPPDKRANLEALRAIIAKVVPDATVAIKWGVPFYSKGGKSVCALASFKDEVAINFFAPPDKLLDPGKKLEGAGKRNRMYKVRTAKELDKAMRITASRARLGT